MNTKNKILLFFGVICCSILTTPLIGKWYDLYITPISNWFWGPSHPEYITGFTLSFLFFGSLLSWLFVAQKKKKYWLSYILPFLIFMLLLGAFEELIIGIGLVAAGWLLAQGILLIKKKSQ